MVYGCREGREREHGIACPFVDGEWITCVHPLLDGEDSHSVSDYLDESAPPAPEWCPMHDRPITLHRCGGAS